MSPRGRSVVVIVPKWRALFSKTQSSQKLILTPMSNDATAVSAAWRAPKKNYRWTVQYDKNCSISLCCIINNSQPMNALYFLHILSSTHFSRQSGWLLRIWLSVRSAAGRCAHALDRGIGKSGFHKKPIMKNSALMSQICRSAIFYIKKEILSNPGAFILKNGSDPGDFHNSAVSLPSGRSHMYSTTTLRTSPLIFSQPRDIHATIVVRGSGLPRGGCLTKNLKPTLL